MKLSRRGFQSLMLGTVALPFAAALAWGDDYPNHPVRLIVGFPAGSGPDIVARIIGQGLSEKLGQSIVVENRPGAGSNLATSDVAHASPDGYMLMLLTTANVINATLYQNLNYDLQRDIAPVASIDNEPFVLVVNPSVPANTMSEFIAYAKANPGKITMSSAGIGSAPHIFGEMLQKMAGVQFTHVPYRGNPLPDLIAGQVDFFIGPVQSSLEYIRAGKLRALADDDGEAVRRLARRAGDRRFRAGVRSERVAWHRRAQSDAARCHCAAQSGDQCNVGRAGR